MSLGSPLRRPFLLGAVSGLASAMAMLIWVDPSILPGHYNLRIFARGADLSQHGATRLVITDGRGMEAAQGCVGACDDLAFKAQLGEAGPVLRVYAADGREVAAGGTYVSGSMGSVLTVNGGERLTVAVE